jgi:uncharacterized protein YndB with AHSA1/START domain
MSGSDDRDVIELPVTLPGTIDEVWRLLVDPDHVRAWFGDHVRLEAGPGGWFREVWSDGARQVTTTGRVVVFRPPTEIAWTWADDDWPCETRLTLRLSARKADVTSVTLTHSGWSRLEAESGRSLRDAHESGWQRHLQSLESYATRIAVRSP